MTRYCFSKRTQVITSEGCPPHPDMVPTWVRVGEGRKLFLTAGMHGGPLLTTHPQATRPVLSEYSGHWGGGSPPSGQLPFEPSAWVASSVRLSASRLPGGPVAPGHQLGMQMLFGAGPGICVLTRHPGDSDAGSGVRIAGRGGGS